MLASWPAGAQHEYKAVDLHDKSPEFVELYRKVVQDPAANAKVGTRTEAVLEQQHCKLQ